MVETAADAYWWIFILLAALVLIGLVGLATCITIALDIKAMRDKQK